MLYSISHNLTNQKELSRVIFLSDDRIAYNTYIVPREPQLFTFVSKIFFFIFKRQLLQILRRKYHETPDKQHLSKKPSLFKFQTTN